MGSDTTPTERDREAASNTVAWLNKNGLMQYQQSMASAERRDIHARNIIALAIATAREEGVAEVARLTRERDGLRRVCEAVLPLVEAWESTDGDKATALIDALRAALADTRGGGDD